MKEFFKPCTAMQDGGWAETQVLLVYTAGCFVACQIVAKTHPINLNS